MDARYWGPMFERFTDPARRVLVLAQVEARLLNHNFIGTEHILLGLLHEGEGLAAQALAALNVNLYDARKSVEETIGPAGTPAAGSPPFTPRAKKVLELSLREALQLGHSYIGTEHILLGLVREGEGVAAQVLVRLGADLSSVRQEVIQLTAEWPARASGPVGDIGAALRQPSPRCSWCRSDLSESARFRTIDVQPDETGVEAGLQRATVLYCSRCGTVISAATVRGTLPGGGA
jgi:ATP-dependent Clp protease ATP-binding subunit ClpC